MIASRGLDKIDLLLALIVTDESIPALARSLFAQLGAEFAATEARLKQINAELLDWHRQDEVSRRLAQIPGVGPIGATMLALKILTRAILDRRATSQPGSVLRREIIRPEARRGFAELPVPATKLSSLLAPRRWFGKCGVTGDGHGLGCNAFWSASHRSWLRWRWPTSWPASPGS